VANDLLILLVENDPEADRGVEAGATLSISGISAAKRSVRAVGW
jgi:hypothetical protein